MKKIQDRLLRAIELGESLSAEDLAFSATNWGDIKFDKAASRPFHAAARADKARAVKEAEEAAFREAQGAPDRGVFRAPSDGPGSFRVNASVSEVPGDFRMRLDDGVGAAGKRKPSRTFVQVLEQGVYRGKAVTKVLFRSVVRLRFCFGAPLLSLPLSLSPAAFVVSVCPMSVFA